MLILAAVIGIGILLFALVAGTDLFVAERNPDELNSMGIEYK